MTMNDEANTIVRMRGRRKIEQELPNIRNEARGENAGMFSRFRVPARWRKSMMHLLTENGKAELEMRLGADDASTLENVLDQMRSELTTGNNRSLWIRKEKR